MRKTSRATQSSRPEIALSSHRTGPIEAIVRATPIGSYARRIWFLYEWLLGTELDLPPAEKGAYALIVDPAQQWAAAGTTSSRRQRREWDTKEKEMVGGVHRPLFVSEKRTWKRTERRR
jgi:hypothetical protein